MVLRTETTWRRTKLHPKIVTLVSYFIIHSSVFLNQLILLMTGVEPNPGQQIWLCSVCGNRIINNIPSVKCNQYSNWCHLKYCITLKSHQEFHRSLQQGETGPTPGMDLYCMLYATSQKYNFSNCEGWCHMRRCSGLVNHKPRSPNFNAPCSTHRSE